MSSLQGQKKISIYRFNPKKDEKPYVQDYVVDLSEVKGQMLLNAIEAIKLQDPTLAIRRSCGEGVCGSDGMSINGKNGLACITPLSELPDHITLRPLPGLPVIRDLVVDMTIFYEHYERVKPYLVNDDVPMCERTQTPEERAKLDGLYECILCACCSTSCPSFWWNPDKFLGPAALLAAWRFVVDSRDKLKAERLAALKDSYSAFRCRSIMNCVRSCPKKLNPTQAIAKLRHEMLDENL